MIYFIFFMTYILSKWFNKIYWFLKGWFWPSKNGDISDTWWLMELMIAPGLYYPIFIGDCHHPWTGKSIFNKAESQGFWTLGTKWALHGCSMVCPPTRFLDGISASNLGIWLIVLTRVGCLIICKGLWSCLSFWRWLWKSFPPYQYKGMIEA